MLMIFSRAVVGQVDLCVRVVVFTY